MADLCSEKTYSEMDDPSSITRNFHSAGTEHFANTLDELIARPVRKSFSRSGEVDHLLTVTACLL